MLKEAAGYIDVIVTGGEVALPQNLVVAKELAIVGSFRFHDEFALAVALIDERRVDLAPMLTGRFDAADAVVAHGLGVLGRVAHPQQTAVDDGVQGLHPAVHHLGETGQVRDILHRQAGARDRRPRAPCGHQLDAEVGQHLGGLDQPGLVGDRDQGAPGRDTVGGGREIRRGGQGGLLMRFKEIAQASGI